MEISSPDERKHLSGARLHRNERTLKGRLAAKLREALLDRSLCGVLHARVVARIDAQTALQGQIFLRAQTDPTVGFNMASDPVYGMTVGPQTWFTEILDSNVLSEIDMAIFQPPQYFYAY